MTPEEMMLFCSRVAKTETDLILKVELVHITYNKLQEIVDMYEKGDIEASFLRKFWPFSLKEQITCEDLQKQLNDTRYVDDKRQVMEKIEWQDKKIKLEYQPLV